MKNAPLRFPTLTLGVFLAASTLHAAESSLILKRPPGWDGFTLQATVETGYRPAGAASPEVGTSDSQISIVNPAGAHAPGEIIAVPTATTNTRPSSGDRKDQAKATLDLRYVIGSNTEADKFVFDYTTTTSAVSAEEDFGSGLQKADAFARITVTLRSQAPLLATVCPGASFLVPGIPALTDPATETAIAVFTIPNAGRPPETASSYVTPVNGFLTAGNPGVRFFLDMWEATPAHGDEVLNYTFTYEVVTPFGSDPTHSYMLEGEAGVERTVVTNTNDSGAGSLRQALLDVPVAGAITFAPNLGGQTINLSSGPLAVAGRDFSINANELPDKVTIDAGNLSRVLEVTDASDLRLHNLTLTGGNASGTGLDSRGGGIRLADSALALTDCCVTDNHASGRGGGLSCDGSSLRLLRTLVEGNTAGGSGGGIVSSRNEFTTASVTLIDSEFRNNTSGDDGGAITQDGNSFPDFQFTRCSFIRNHADNEGGALHRVQGPYDHCTFARNSAGLRAGAIYQTLTTEIRHCTITENTAPVDEGGGVYVAAATTTVFSSIIAGNTGSDVDILTSSPTADYRSAGHNMIGNGSGDWRFTKGGDVRGIVDPLLSPPGDYGGPTTTLLPLFNSPATDAGATDLDSPAFDQRGLSRVVDGDGDGTPVADAGAAETELPLIIVTNGFDSGPGSLRQAIADIPWFGLIAFDYPTALTVRLESELSTTNNKTFTVDGGLIRPGRVIIKGQRTTRLFNISANGNTTLRNLILTGGRSSDGGAILNNPSADLLLIDCELNGNQADRGGAILSERGGSLSLIRCNLRDNHALEEGGGLHNSGALLVNESTISGNSSGSVGGGLWSTNVSQATTSLNSCVVSNNFAEIGGGLYLRLGTGSTLATQCSFHGNYARSSGGALSTLGGTATFDHCTFWGNFADRQGGAVSTHGGLLNLRHVTMAGNRAPRGGGIYTGPSYPPDPNNDVAAYASLLAGNSGDDLTQGFPSGQIVSGGYNVVGLGSGASFFDQPGDQSGVTDPLLSPPCDFGGGLLTLLPLPGSPALDRGSNGTNPSLDQRGEPRLQDGNGDGSALLDAGAVEAPHPDNTLLVTNANDNGAGSLRQAIADATVPGTRIAFDSGLNGSVLNLSSGPLVVDERTLLIDAQNLSTGFTIDGNGVGTVMETEQGTGAALRNLTIQGGGPVPGSPGSGIRSQGYLTLDQCRVRENENEIVSGAGIRATGFPSACLILVNSDVSENGKAALSGGGGIRVAGMNAILVDSTLRNNFTTSAGGGLLNVAGATLLSECEVSGNRAQIGAGLSHGGFTVMARCTVEANTATLDGGGTHHSQGKLILLDSTFSQNLARDGGGLLNDTTNSIFAVNNVRASQATFFANNASRYGGAISNNGGDLSLRHATLAGNQAVTAGSGIATAGNQVAETSLFATIVADNPGIDVAIVEGASDQFTSEGFNLVSQFTGTSAFTQPGDMTGILDPVLSSPGFHGGPTETIIPLAGSPARDRFPFVIGMPSSDQRGLPRAFRLVSPVLVDIGAYEAGGQGGYPVWAQEFIPAGEDMSFTGHADRDRNPNGLEYGVQTDPDLSDPGSPNNAVVSEKEGIMRIAFRFQPLAFDVAWRVVRATDLQNWAEIYRFDGSTETLAPGIDSDFDLPNRRITVDDTNPPAPEAYYRLEVLYTP